MKSKLNFNDRNGWNRIQSVAIIRVKEKENDVGVIVVECVMLTRGWDHTWV